MQVSNPMSYLTTATDDQVYAKMVRRGLLNALPMPHLGGSPNGKLEFWVSAQKIQAIASDQTVVFFDASLFSENYKYKADGSAKSILDRCTYLEREPDFILNNVGATINGVKIDDMLPAPSIR